ncbi:hypothetical protein EON65_26955 [archaeon]|nr:MAG: hypothetical protein EON65_26955 [archaeon]
MLIISIYLGIDVLGYISSQEELMLWKPDITFQQVNSFDVVAEMFKMFPRGVFYWSRHVVCTFTQPALDYHTYPSDTQNFSLVIQSYGYSSYFIDTNFINNEAVVLVQNFQNNKANVEQNQLWSYQSYTAYTEDILQANFANPDRTFSMGLINLVFTRQSDGITVRFLVPLTLLILLSALTYWIYYENRVDITITILVSVSALYIVILQNLPMVGYLTDADRFVFWVSLAYLLSCWQ